MNAKFLGVLQGGQVSLGLDWLEGLSGFRLCFGFSMVQKSARHWWQRLRASCTRPGLRGPCTGVPSMRWQGHVPKHGRALSEMGASVGSCPPLLSINAERSSERRWGFR